jgi:hypothetical protein
MDPFVQSALVLVQISQRLPAQPSLQSHVQLELGFVELAPATLQPTMPPLPVGCIIRHVLQSSPVNCSLQVQEQLEVSNTEVLELHVRLQTEQAKGLSVPFELLNWA